jgi:chaperonin cofactor prefoldin
MSDNFEKLNDLERCFKNVELKRIELQKHLNEITSLYDEIKNVSRC